VKTRREFLIASGAGLCALAAPLDLLAQKEPARVARIGFLGAASASSWASRIEALRAGLRDLGYVEGKNLVIEFRWAEGKYDRLPDLAAELVRLKVDVLLTHGTPGSRAAKQATTAIPIVMVLVGDPVATGLVASLARPGGNITGSTFFNRELAAKRLELVKECFPRIRRIAQLENLDNPTSGLGPQGMELTARSLNVELQQFGVRGPKDFENAFTAMARDRIEAVAVDEEGMLNSNLGLIADLATKQRLPSTGSALFADAGGLIGYGINNPELYRRASYFVDKILKGAKPAELPIERPTKFEVVLNMRTAKAVGIKFPKTIIVRADRVIE
jgi:putative ABC transport system substrate-binding protein